MAQAPPGAIVVARPTKWGNPYRIGSNQPELYVIHDDPVTGVASVVWTTPRSDSAAQQAHAEAVRRYEDDLLAGHLAFTVNEVRAELAGHDLCCWCRPGLACHADVLIRIANPTTASHEETPHP